MFRLDVNLDTEEGMTEFLELYEPSRGRLLANRLGFKGHGCVAAADALMNYAHNKRAAIMCRKTADEIASRYEAICDDIYREDIQPVIKCW